MKKECRVELHIRVEPAVGFVLCQETQVRLLHRTRKLVKLPISLGRVEPLGGLCEHVGARISDTIDTMTKPHKPLAPFELAANDGFRSIRLPDVQDHVEGRPGRAAMKGALQSPHC